MTVLQQIPKTLGKTTLSYLSLDLQIPQAICIECFQKCCRSPFRQMFTGEEMVPILAEKGSKYASHFEKYDLSAYLSRKTITGECCFLKDGLCNLYLLRGLDCRIYPLIFEYDPTKGTVKFSLDLSESCGKYVEQHTPRENIMKIVRSILIYIQTWSIDDLIAYTHMEPNSLENAESLIFLGEYPLDSHK